MCNRAHKGDPVHSHKQQQNTVGCYVWGRESERDIWWIFLSIRQHCFIACTLCVWVIECEQLPKGNKLSFRQHISYFNEGLYDLASNSHWKWISFGVSVSCDHNCVCACVLWFINLYLFCFIQSKTKRKSVADTNVEC